MSGTLQQLDILLEAVPDQLASVGHLDNLQIHILGLRDLFKAKRPFFNCVNVVNSKYAALFYDWKQLNRCVE